MKKLLKIVVLVGLLVLLLNIGASAKEYSGTCGSTNWVFDDVSGELTLSGSGGVPDNVTATYYPWHEYRKSIKSVVIENSVTSIGSLAFSNCSNLTDVSMGDNVYSIGSSAFSYCSSLKKIELPDKMVKISANLFFNCTSLEEIVIPENVTFIDMYAFYSCTNLKSVEFGEKIVRINEYAFSNCNNLNSVYIKNLEKWCAVEMDNMSASPFYNGADLYVNGEKITGLAINSSTAKDATKINDYVFYGCGSITKLVVGDNVSEIGKYSFAKCSNMKSVSIEDSVTKIGNGAFNQCEALEKVKLSHALQGELGIAVFGYCSSLKYVEIPSDITAIGALFFRNCTGLTSIEIPASVTSIGEGAFYSCNDLADIYFGGSKEEWENIAVSQYNDVLENVTIHYNSELKKEIIITYTYLNGKLVINAENLDDDSVIIVKGTKDGIDTVRVCKYVYDEDIPVEAGTEYDSVKIMVWDSFADMRPVCEPTVVADN